MSLSGVIKCIGSDGSLVLLLLLLSLGIIDYTGNTCFLSKHHIYISYYRHHV